MGGDRATTTTTTTMTTTTGRLADLEVAEEQRLVQPEQHAVDTRRAFVLAGPEQPTDRNEGRLVRGSDCRSHQRLAYSQA